MTIMVAAFKRLVPPAGVMAGIFFLSHQPGETLPLPALPGLDKLAHFAVYGLLAATLIRACRPAMRQAPTRPCGRDRHPLVPALRPH